MMEKAMNYRIIYGCPKHGTTNGTMDELTVPELNLNKTPCFQCNTCKKVYIEPDNSPVGDTKHWTKAGFIWKIIGPFPIPEKIFVYDKNTNKGFCTCPGDVKRKTKTITHFLMKTGVTEELVYGIKICLSCNKAFIASELVNKKMKTFFEKNNIKIMKIGETAEKNQFDEEKKQRKMNDHRLFDNDWEDEVYVSDDFRIPQNQLIRLKPASRVASAYYDAKISFNPYQYLPWLKMFVNGSKNLLISDEVGLGKTIEAGILIMEELTQDVNSKILIICPAFLREKWYQELNEKFLLDAQVYDGKNAVDFMTNIVILPVSRIKQYEENESEFKYSMVIIDEVHYFKNAKSVRYDFLKKILKEIGDSRRIFMSATPVNNSGNDYHSIAALFDESPDRTNTTKKQAYIYLPERNVKDVYVDLTLEEQTFYDATDALDPFSGTVYRHIGASCLYALNRYAYSGDELTSETKEELRYALESLFEGRYAEEIDDSCFTGIKKLAVPEVDSKLSKLQDILQSCEKGSKIVLFSHYIETVKYLHSELARDFNTGYIYANTISNNILCKNIKNKFVDAKSWFCNESEKTTVLICSDSCREGIDLDAANIMINYDLPFNPSILEQRIGRIDRMSQKRDMFVYNFHVNGTYDDRLHFILAAKLRFINFFADYGIGNPLNITAKGNPTFDNFIRYFGRKLEGLKDFARMSNEDFSVASRILRQVGVKIEKKEGMDALKMQAVLLEKLNENQELIEKWFDKGEIKKITEEQLLKQREHLEKLLNFPKKINRRIELEGEVLESIVQKANQNPQFRRRIAILIKNYAEKLSEMEITGMPMKISADDLRMEYNFGGEDSNNFIQSSIIELLRNEGAKVYEIN